MNDLPTGAWIEMGKTLPEDTKSNLAACVESLKLIPMLTDCEVPGPNLAKPGNSCIAIPGANVLEPILMSESSS